MALVLFQTRRVRDVLKAGPSIGVDLIVLVAILAIAMALFSFGQEVKAPYRPTVAISLSVWALPKYTMFSLARGFAAYVLSLVFTLIYGSIAAHNHRAEKIMIPVLDVLQSIPVLGFLPSLVLAMIAVFPHTELGLEIACIVMIFTGQAWNMTFSYYSSVRNIPAPLKDVARINGLSRWQVLRTLEVPAAMIGLVWNSMMSMAGGWFFLSVTEAFTLGDQNFQLPGIGSYMAQAIYQRKVGAELAAIVAMVLMIIMVDQFFWRPIVAWSERFKVEETADVDKAQSWVLSMLQHSLVYDLLVKYLRRHKDLRQAEAAPTEKAGKAEGNIPAVEAGNGTGAVSITARAPAMGPGPVAMTLNWVTVFFLSVAALWGAWKLILLMGQVGGRDWLKIFCALLATTARTAAAVALGCLWTLPVGILIGLSAKWSRRLQPVVQVLASFPAPMLFPFVVAIVVGLLHIPFTIGCVVLMLLGTQWYILFNVIAGASAIPGELKEVTRVYRMPRWRRWTRLYIPGVFPHLVIGLMTAAGGAWNVTIVSEYFQARQDQPATVALGLGSMISEAAANKEFGKLAAAVAVMAAAVVIINRLAWKRLYRLAENRYSLNV